MFAVGAHGLNLVHAGNETIPSSAASGCCT
jgi:hypothetical protein